MPKTFRDMVAEGREGTPMLSPQEVQRRMKEEAGTLVVDVRVYGAAEVSKADEERVSEWNYHWGDDVQDEFRDTERDAIVMLAAELERTWIDVLATYARAPSGVKAAGG